MSLLIRVLLTTCLTVPLVFIGCSDGDGDPTDGSGGHSASGRAAGEGGLGGDGGGYGGSTVSEPSRCTSPVEEAGFVDCSEGYRHRPTQNSCTNTARAETIAPGECNIEGECCSSDADCPENSACWETGLDASDAFYGTCKARCENDDDCGQDQICECGDGAGRCVASTCTIDDDCGEGAYCIRSVLDEGCGQKVQYSCQSAADECNTNSDCNQDGPDFEVCATNGNRRACLPQYQSCDS